MTVNKGLTEVSEPATAPAACGGRARNMRFEHVVLASCSRAVGWQFWFYFFPPPLRGV